MEEPAAAEEWQGATQKRKAWAKSRDSWQASEAEDLSAAAAQLARGEEEEEDDEEEEEEEEDRERDHLAGGKLPLAAEAGRGGGWRGRGPRGAAPDGRAVTDGRLSAVLPPGHSVPNEKIAIWLKDCRWVPSPRSGAARCGLRGAVLNARTLGKRALGTVAPVGVSRSEAAGVLAGRSAARA